MSIYLSRDLFPASRGFGMFLRVTTAFQLDDGTMEYSNDSEDGFCLQTILNADEWSIEGDEDTVIVRRTGVGEYEVEIGQPGQAVARCYACGCLYFECGSYVAARLEAGYEPTDFECGCTTRYYESWMDNYEDASWERNCAPSPVLYFDEDVDDLFPCTDGEQVLPDPFPFVHKL